MDSIKVEVTKELLSDILHACQWYQGRDPDRAVRVEDWASEQLTKKALEIEMIEIWKRFQAERKEWLSQFKKGDRWKPKAWKCKKTLQRWCEYEPFNDPACDNCIHCHQPYERK